MNLQELGVAMQYRLGIVVLVFNNGMWGTIRAHQEREFPDRTIALTFDQPGLRPSGGRLPGPRRGRQRQTPSSRPPSPRALAFAERERLPALIEIRYDADGIAPGETLSAIRASAQQLQRERAGRCLNTPHIMSNTSLQINGQRLWQSLMELARVGATEQGGNCRLALTALDGQGRDLVVGWMKDAGLSISVDQVGNIFGRRAGRNPALAPVMTGSHIDTQPTGGKFDGCYGVMAGLEIMRTLQDTGLQTEAPLELAIWTNEERLAFCAG